MSFLEDMITKAKSDIKTIVLPEADDVRTLKAAAAATAKGIAKIVLVGDEEAVNALAKKENADISKCTIINPVKHPKFNEYVETFYEMRKAKGVDMEKAEATMKDYIYFATMMVKMGEADGLVSGAAHSTANTVRPALQILKTKPGTKMVSAFFIMVVPNCEFGANGTFVFADCGLNQNPSSEELAAIAGSSAESFETFVGEKAKVAFLSHSSKGSAKHADIDKVVAAVEIAKADYPQYLMDGELQLDAAIVPSVGASKAPDSPVAGKANVLIFPDLDAGNIGYKLVQRLANADAYGPILQGIAKPVNDLSRGCSSEDIEGVIAITAVQAQG